MNEPVIPLKHAELLHVTLSTIVNVLERRTDYPVDNIQGVIATYRYSRDKHLTGTGMKAADIKLFTEAAAEALITWIEERETRKAVTEADFEAWAKELMDE